MSNPWEYHITSVLDFTKVPQSRLPRCLAEFTDWVQMMRNAQKGTTFQPVNVYHWIDDERRDITVNIVAKKAPEPAGETR